MNILITNLSTPGLLLILLATAVFFITTLLSKKRGQINITDKENENEVDPGDFIRDERIPHSAYSNALEFLKCEAEYFELEEKHKDYAHFTLTYPHNLSILDQHELRSLIPEIASVQVICGDEKTICIQKSKDVSWEDLEDKIFHFLLGHAVKTNGWRMKNIS